jgi:cytochrome P450
MPVTDFDFQPEQPQILADPYPLFARMRAEDPVHWSPRLKGWVLTRYDDIKGVLLASDRMSSDRLRPFFASVPGHEAGRIANIMRYLALWMVFKDAPDHTRLRRLTSRVFHNKSMQAMRPEVERITAWLLDQLAGRERFDFVADIAGPLPCMVIMAMLGVPTEDLGMIKRLSDNMALFIGSARVSSEKYSIAEDATRDMAAYFGRLIELRRVDPGTDLISGLVHLEDGGDRLTQDELVATCILLLFAGHETTTNHIANGLLALMRFPTEMARLRTEPVLAAAAIEELLRFEGPSAAQVRIVARAHDLRGKHLAEGDRVFMMLNAANRDPAVFSDPDALILDRDEAPHLTFGFGLHICLGFPLARLEGQVALPAVMRHFRHIEQHGPAPEWINSMVFRGVKSLEVVVRR